jgi:hypothetical protein
MPWCFPADRVAWACASSGILAASGDSVDPRALWMVADDRTMISPCTGT